VEFVTPEPELAARLQREACAAVRELLAGTWRESWRAADEVFFHFDLDNRSTPSLELELQARQSAYAEDPDSWWLRERIFRLDDELAKRRAA
jgi:hypothetical protein